MVNRMGTNFDFGVINDIDFPKENGDFDVVHRLPRDNSHAGDVLKDTEFVDDFLGGENNVDFEEPAKKKIAKVRAKGGMIIFCFVCFMALSSLYMEESLCSEILFKIKNLFSLSDKDVVAKRARKKSPYEKLKIPTRPKRFPYPPWDERFIVQRSRILHQRMDSKPNYFDRPLRILALGGSVTWGGVIRNRYDAYPSLLAEIHPDSTVDNMALRASGATFPSGCIQSMIEGEAFPEYESLSKEEDRKSKVYDLILLEFSLNGIDGLDFLLYRLRKRFPNAILLYVHLQSFGRHSIQLDNEQLMKMMAPVNGIFYKMPSSEFVPGDDTDNQFYQLYGMDRHHLSEVGHKYVANAIVDLLHHQQVQITPEPILGSWGGGDQCYFWMNSLGNFPTDLKANGGQLKMFDSFLEKWAYEIEVANHGQFSFDLQTNDDNNQMMNGSKNNVPIYLVYMAKKSLYPSARVITNPNENENAIFFIDKTPTDFHITQSTHIGNAIQGTNIIKIDSIKDSELPLRIVGIMICTACLEWENNIINRIYMRLPEIHNVNS